MNSYYVGQIVYVVLNKRVAVQPFRIVEIITKRTLDGEETNYRLQGGPNSSSSVMLNDLDGELFETSDAVRTALVERAAEQIDKIVDDAMSKSFDWYGAATSSPEKMETKTIHELPEIKPRPRAELPPSKPKIMDDPDVSTVMMPDGTMMKVKLPKI